MKQITQVLDAEEMLRAAEKETGLTDWGLTDEWGGDFRPAYEVFVRALNTEARLSEKGTRFTRDRIMDLLRGRLQIVEDRKRFPGIKDERITTPIFVIGLGRSGTTFMSHLLAQDPEHRAAQTWEVRLPSPPPEAATYNSDPRITKVHEIYKEVGWLDQDIQEVHPTGAQRYEECPYMHAHAFVSAEFAAYWDIPSYMDLAWASSDFRRIYRLQHSFLQHLQHRYRGNRWVLKSGAHMPYLSELITVFPDTFFVNCIRDPAKVVASRSNAFMRLRKRYSDQLPPSEHSAMEGLQTCAYLVNKAMTFFDEHPEFEERCFNAQFVDVQKDPMAVVGQIYDKFGIPLTEERAGTMNAWLKADREKHTRVGTHSYSLQDMGLDYATIDKHFGKWIDRFPIKLEREA